MDSEIDAPFALSDRQIEQFRSSGFIRLRGLLAPATLAHYGVEITRHTLAQNGQHKPLPERSTYDRAFLQVMNLWQTNALVREFVMGRRLAGIAAALLEVRGVRLYHDQSLYKEPGGGITPAHADQHYWPLASDRTVTAWIPLQAVPRAMGPLAFYAGSQRVESGRQYAISDESEREIDALMRARGCEYVDAPYEAGEVSFHLGWTFHRAGANTSGQPRSVMTIIYMDQDMRLAEPIGEMQRKDREQWCHGTEVGAVIATPGNPLLYTRVDHAGLAGPLLP